MYKTIGISDSLRIAGKRIGHDSRISLGGEIDIASGGRQPFAFQLIKAAKITVDHRHSDSLASLALSMKPVNPGSAQELLIIGSCDRR